MKTIMDIGCGGGNNYIIFLKSRNLSIVGLDIYLDYLIRVKRSGEYSDVILADLKTLCFRSRSCDAIIMSEVLEHVSKTEAENVLGVVSDICKKIIVTVPNGNCPQEGHNNPFMRHRSSWSGEELRRRGFNVIGIRGLKTLTMKEQGANPLIRLFLYVSSILMLPITLISPLRSYQLVAFRDSGNRD